LLLLAAVVVGCGALPATPAGAPGATAAVDVEEVSLEISALM